MVLRQIGGHGYFRSRDIDGGQTIRSAIAKNPRIYANCTALSVRQFLEDLDRLKMYQI